VSHGAVPQAFLPRVRQGVAAVLADQAWIPLNSSEFYKNNWMKFRIRSLFTCLEYILGALVRASIS
jgi:hypothetical protein